MEEGKHTSYNTNKSIDGETYQEKGNKIIRTRADGKITKGELRPRLKIAEISGLAYKNRCKTDASTCEFGNNTGDITDNDLNIPAGIAWLESICITKSDLDKEKPYKILYKQESGGNANLRTENTETALSKMDCSELVCRYLNKIGWSKDVKWLNTSGIIDFAFKSPHKLVETNKPSKGDIFAWKGHTGVIVSVNNDDVTTIEAISEKSNSRHKGYDFKGVVKWNYKLDEGHLKGSKRSQKLYFYTPKIHYSNE